MSMGEHPVFSDVEKREIRRALNLKWQQTHSKKNRSDDRRERDVLSERMRRLESLMDKVGSL